MISLKRPNPKRERFPRRDAARVTPKRVAFQIVAAIAAFVAFANVCPLSLWAQGAQTVASSADTLALERVIEVALRENPELRSARAGWEAMRERPALERTLPNPMFKYGGMDMTRRGDWPNTDEKRFMVEQEFPWFGKLGLRGQVAAKGAETMQREYEAMQREVIQMVKESYFDLYGVQHSLSITRAEEDVLERMATVATTKYSTGEVAQQDVLKAQAEISMVREKLYTLEQQEAVLKARINQLLNRNPDSPLGMAVTPPAGAFDLDLDELFATARRNRPEIKGAQAQIEGNQAERELMKKESFPDYRLGVEYRSFRAGEDMVMFTVGFDLPIWRSKYKAGVREAEKTIESSEAAKEAAEKQIAFDVADAHFKLLAARRTLDLYKNVLIPQAQARFEASEAGYGTGNVDFLDLLESERFLLNARVMAAMTEGSVGMQAARLERAIGTDLRPAEEPEGEKP